MNDAGGLGSSLRAFSNWRHNAVVLKFPNGNSISTVWAAGSYSDNHHRWLEREPINEDPFRLFMESDQVEVMFDCGPRLSKRLHEKFDGDGQVIGYIGIIDWLYIVNALAREVTEAA